MLYLCCYQKLLLTFWAWFPTSVKARKSLAASPCSSDSNWWQLTIKPAITRIEQTSVLWKTEQLLCIRAFWPSTCTLSLCLLLVVFFYFVGLFLEIAANPWVPYNSPYNPCHFWTHDSSASASWVLRLFSWSRFSLLYFYTSLMNTLCYNTLQLNCGARLPF